MADDTLRGALAEGIILSMNPIASATLVAQSGLNAASTKLAVSADNTANGNTDNFVPSRAVAEERAEGGVRVNISREARDLAPQTPAGTPPVRGEQRAEPSRTDVVEETANRILAAAAFRSNLKTVEAADEQQKTLLDSVEPRRVL